MEFGDHGGYMVAVSGRMECAKEPEIENATALLHPTEVNSAMDHNNTLSNVFPVHVVNYMIIHQMYAFLIYSQ